jgi:hypothetical protein
MSSFRLYDAAQMLSSANVSELLEAAEQALDVGDVKTADYLTTLIRVYFRERNKGQK